jgi:hypothetical protein
MTTAPPRPLLARPIVGVVLGLVAGTGLLILATRLSGPAPASPIAIGIDGVPMRMARDLLLPPFGWTLQVEVPSAPGDAAKADAGAPSTLLLELREERTGLTIEIQDQLIGRDGYSTVLIPESLGIREGLLAVRARATFADGSESEDWRRLRIRRWIGGPPIGRRQIIQYDFEVDRDGDGRPDFEADLEALGLVARDRGEIAKAAAARIADRALARVARAYDDPGDPNRTGQGRDPVAIRFQREPVTRESERPYTTRICVGGRDPAQPGSVGHVRFDARNARKASTECTGPEPAGLFPAELGIYRASPLFREVLGPFEAASGGVPLGGEAGDAERLAGAADARGTSAAAVATRAEHDPRGAQIERAIAVLGDVLGTLMAHETGHALGLVGPGKPGIGLFGGAEGDAFAHAITPDGKPPAKPSLMDPGRGFLFEDLAGEGLAGELRFRPIDYAYLRDRVVLSEMGPTAPTRALDEGI